MADYLAKSLKNENNETCPLKNPNIWEIRLTFFVNKKIISKFVLRPFNVLSWLILNWNMEPKKWKAPDSDYFPL